MHLSYIGMLRFKCQGYTTVRVVLSISLKTPSVKNDEYNVRDECFDDEFRAGQLTMYSSVLP